MADNSSSAPADPNPYRSPAAVTAAVYDRPTRIRWLIFGLSCATSWFLYLHRYTWNFVMVGLQDDYGYTREDTSQMYSIFNAAYGLGQIPGGMLCDYFGPHVLLTVMIVVWSAATAGIGLSSAPWFLYLQRIAFGLAQAGCYPTLSKVSQVWFPPRIRTFLQGWVASFFGRSGAAMSAIIMVTVLMGWCGLSWQWAVAVMGAGGIALGASFWMLFRNSPQIDGRVNDAERSLVLEGRVAVAPVRHVLPWSRVIVHRSLLMALFMQFLAAGADTFFGGGFLGDYFLKTKGLTMANAGLIASLPFWGGALGGMVGGLLNDRLIRRTGNRRWSRSFVGCFGPLVATGLIFVVLQQQSGLAAGLAMFAVKFFFDMGQPTVWGACTDMAGKYTGTVFSIINTAGTLGGVVFPLLFGMLATRFTTAGVVKGVPVRLPDYNVVFLALAAAYVVSALCWFFIDCTHSLEDDATPDASPQVPA